MFLPANSSPSLIVPVPVPVCYLSGARSKAIVLQKTARFEILFANWGPPARILVDNVSHFDADKWRTKTGPPLRASMEECHQWQEHGNAVFRCLSQCFVDVVSVGGRQIRPCSLRSQVSGIPFFSFCTGGAATLNNVEYSPEADAPKNSYRNASGNRTFINVGLVATHSHYIEMHIVSHVGLLTHVLFLLAAAAIYRITLPCNHCNQEFGPCHYLATRLSSRVPPCPAS